MIGRRASSVFGALVFGALACAAEPEPKPDNWQVQADAVHLDHASPARFDLAEVSFGDPLPGPQVTGRVTTLESVTSPSFAPLPGRVQTTLVRIGDRVEAGERLVRVQAGDLPGLESELATAQLAVRTQQATVDKLEQMVEARLAAERDLILARAELAQARLASKAAASKLRSLAVGPSGDASYWILANRSGTVVQLDAALGRQVGPAQDHPVATIADLDEVLVIADVPPQEAARLNRGTPASVTIPGSMHPAIMGSVELISDILDSERQTLPTRIRVANRERALRPNTYVDVRFEPADQAPVLRVPASAVVRDGAQTVVFVDAGAQTYRSRIVEVGRRSTTEVEILHGLEPGERVVTTNALLLRNAVDLET